MLPNEYQKFIHASRYARFVEEENRRETWDETVSRYCSYFSGKFGDVFPANEIYDAIVNLEIMPSMRALMTAGPALERDNVAGYNCSYKSVDHPRVFDEIMYILLCGTGVGFSVERQFIAQLPAVSDEFHETDTTIVVADSKIGWASAFRELVSLLYSGKLPKWDLSRIRAAGIRLKTFGGRASGPEPLDNLFRFTASLFNSAKGRKLNSVEAHDLICKIADVVVVGGVRRSALLSLSNLTDERMQRAKSGQWWEANGQRALANNSVAYTEKPDVGIFLREWQNLYDSKSGERGIFNRASAKRAASLTERRNTDQDFGTNPCGEIILRDAGFCNLTEAIIRSGDSFEAIKRKVELASVLGTFQSTLTDFRYLRPIWKKNAEEERLLGVSLTGIMDHAGMSGTGGHGLEETLGALKQHAIDTNKEWAAILGINPSAAITTVKPSGTVSQLVDSSSGIHPRYSPYYIRTVRADKKDPLAQFMRDKGFPCEDDVTKPNDNYVFSFPIKSPSGSVTNRDFSAQDQLDLYLVYKKYWCEHNPSQTIYYKDSDFMDVGAWVYKNWDDLGGLSFLPQSDHVYKQAPYQEITEDEYEKALEAMPKDVDFTELVEELDNTTASQELACLGGVCEL